MGAESKKPQTASPYQIIDLRNEEEDLLDTIYKDLLQVHFPVADELDDIEDVRENLTKVPDGRFPELHILIAKDEANPVACCYYEYYPVGNFAFMSYLCVLDSYRGKGLAGRLIEKLEQQMVERCDGKPLDAMFAETHEVNVEDGIMDASVRQKVLKSLGFRCLKYDYTQPPLSANHKPCGGLRLLVKDRPRLPGKVVIAYLDDFAGSVFEYDNSWKTEQYYIDQAKALSESPFVEATDELPW